MLTLEVSNFNIVIAVLGGWISLCGLVSYLLKEKFYLSEARSARRSPTTQQISEDGMEISGLAARPIMVAMWLATSLLVWALIPNLPFLHALAIGACVTPTDPVLSNVIVKERFADHNIPKDLQKNIIDESGANDGLGYPFLFFALYLIKYTGDEGRAESGGAAAAMGFVHATGSTEKAFSLRNLPRTIHRRHLRDDGKRRYPGLFVAGNVFTWNDWFRLETLDDSLQPTISMLLNVTIFMWYGAVCPWHSFAVNGVIPLYRLVALNILILLFRRMPFIFGFHKFIHQIELASQAIFMGFFGPIGCSAMFYLYITLDFVEGLKERERHDVDNLNEAVRVIVWFMLVSSVVIHGLSIPLGKFGLYLPRTLSGTITGDQDEPIFRIRNISTALPQALSLGRFRTGSKASSSHDRAVVPSRSFYTMYGSINPRKDAADMLSQMNVPPTKSRTPEDGSPANSPAEQSAESSQNLSPPALPNQTVRFYDESTPLPRGPSTEL
ncbi:hypothetical protein DL767_008092 [Monosporascus sp. MG133]|nr:hypothetical protein DL767_008092 [Monosporascus sp. MG133]